VESPSIFCFSFLEYHYSDANHNTMKKIKNTTLLEQFQNPIEKSQKETKSIILTHKYMTSLPWLGTSSHKVRLKTFTQGQIIIAHQVSPIIVIGIDVCLP
jgi:hypothetical protein